MSKEEEPWRGGPCPVCGGQTLYELDCPGYGTSKSEGGQGIMVCSPCCGNTTVAHCDADGWYGCGWWYSDLWRRGDYTKKPMGQRPDWYKSFDDVMAEAFAESIEGEDEC